jgi:hypothetical protein
MHLKEATKAMKETERKKRGERVPHTAKIS